MKLVHTYGVPAEQYGGGQYVVLVVVVEVFADDERRGHVDQGRADSVQQRVRQEQPLHRA